MARGEHGRDQLPSGRTFADSSPSDGGGPEDFRAWAEEAARWITAPHERDHFKAQAETYIRLRWPKEAKARD